MKNTLIILMFTLVVSTSCASIQQRNLDKVVFIHGANFTAKSWKPLIDKVDDVEHISINLPGRMDSVSHKDIDLDMSSQALCEYLEQIDGKLSLVAHSQAGAIVNHSLTMCPSIDIKKIIYISAVVPLDGEKVFAKLNKEDDKQYFSGIEYDKVSSSLNIIDDEKFIKSFVGETNAKNKELILSSAVSEPSQIGEGVVKMDATRFNSIPKYYIKTLKDKIISLESQKNIISGINFKKVFSIDSTHLPMITHSEELALIFQEILE